MEESLLYRAASVWQSVMQYKYSFVYGYKRKLYTINLAFTPEVFLHLAGFHYLKDLTLPRFSSAKTLAKILDGTISQRLIEKGCQYEKMVKPRLLSLVGLENMLDQEFKLYSYKSENSPFHSLIKADYLIASHLDNVNFIFLIRGGEQNTVSDYICCSTFIMGDRDFEQNQRNITLMKKTKTRLSDNSTQVLYLKEGFIETDSSH